jgi:hypothetical protein
MKRRMIKMAGRIVGDRELLTGFKLPQAKYAE